eukprot:Nitzschia sp. Nitz4//scaffold194_size40385//35385//39212//NITZ4_007534-RA/size40385-augustus-gene-0.11-mRNA-1//1//CDS//3329540346//29//frame0
MKYPRVDDEDQGPRSCLVVRGFGRKNRRGAGNKNGLISSAASTDQSSTAENIFNPNANNDHQQLLAKSNQLTTNWYDDDVAWGSENGSNHVSEQHPGSQPASLLNFPTPTDRSHHARKRSSQQKGAMHAYDGEMEPEGVRGQEAKIGATQSDSAYNIPIRNFKPGTPTPVFPESGASMHIQLDVDNLSTTSSQDLHSFMQEEFSDPKGQVLRSESQSQLELAPRKGIKTEKWKPPIETYREKELANIPEKQSTDQSKQSSDDSLQNVRFPADETMELLSTRNRPQHTEPTPKQQYANVKLSSNPWPDTASENRENEDYHENYDNYDDENEEEDEEEEPYQLPQNMHRHQKHPANTRPRSQQSAYTAVQPRSSAVSPPRQNPDNSYNQADESFPDVSHEISSQGSEDYEVPKFRKSAPVNVDDSSFEDPLQNVQGIHAMAMEHVMRGEYDMALQAFSQVLTVYLELYGRAHPLTASAYHNLGTVHSKRAGLLLDNTLHQRHCLEQSLLCFQAAARSARDSPQLGPSHPNVAVSLVRIGFLLLQSRQYQNAVITFQEALRIRLEHYGPTHSLVANLYNNLGVCHMHLQEFVVGRRYLQQALDIQKELLAQDEFSSTALLELADTLCNIGGLCLEWIRQQGPDARHALDAESSFLEALEVRVKVLGEKHALTNQVRSLHDMVRSIPLPKMSPRSTHGSTSVPSPGRSVASKTSSLSQGIVGRSLGPGTVATVSPIASTIETNSRTGHAPDALNLPQLDDLQRTQLQQQRHKEDPPESPSRSNGNSSSNRNIRPQGGFRPIQSRPGNVRSIPNDELKSYELTEENCLLDPVQEDGQVTVVSYAQSTASKADSDRLAYVMQAKAVLQANKAYLDSPHLAMGNSTGTKHTDMSPQNNYEQLEDGLVPLGGNWPRPTRDRISPDVLQEPSQHLPLIHSTAVNRFKGEKFGEALHLLEIVVDTQREKNGPVHEDVGAALYNIGIVQLRLEESYKALQAFEESVRVRKGALGRDHPHVAVSLVKVGITLMVLKRFEDSLWIFREALTVRKHALGQLHPSTARIYNNIGCVHVEINEPSEAKRAFEAAIDIQRNALVNDPDNGPILFGAATTLQNLAYLYKHRQMYEKEAVFLQESLEIQEKVLGSSHSSVLATLDALASAFASLGRENEALRCYSGYLERLYEADDDTFEQQALALFKMSQIHEATNDTASALNKLHLASKMLRSAPLSAKGKELESQIQHRMHEARLELDNKGSDWV